MGNTTFSITTRRPKNDNTDRENFKFEVVDVGSVRLVVGCDDCDGEWTEIYALKSYEYRKGNADGKR